MNIELAVVIGFLSLLTLAVVLAVSDNADKISEYKYDSEEY